MLEEGTGGTGWAGQQIIEVRFDPHEDRGVRCFTLDEIRISATDIAAPRFTVKFRDDANGIGAPNSGTVADIFLDAAPRQLQWHGNRLGARRGAGRQHLQLVSGGVAPGHYWIRVRLTDGSGKQSSAYASAPIAVACHRSRSRAGTRTEVNSSVGGEAALVNLTMVDGAASGLYHRGSSATTCSQ